MKLNARELMEDNRIKMKKPQKGKMNPKILLLLGAIVLVIIAIIVILFFLNEIQSADSSLGVYINNIRVKNYSENTFKIENNEIYVNVRKFASLVGYDSHSGEYKIDAEDSNKVFVENQYETASMFLNSTTISKVYTNSNEEYKNYTMSSPARRINGEIYIPIDGIRIACNVSAVYDSEKNIISIGTLEYNYQIYNNWAQKNGYQQVSNEFENVKAILYDRVVVQSTDGRYGVINSRNEEVIGTRYSNIVFDEYTQEFTITNTYGKVGIDFINGDTKINVDYDEIKSIQKENELYLVKSNNKYGIIDSRTRIVIHLEYDDIGIDMSNYITNTVTRVTSTPTPTTQTGEEVTPTEIKFEMTNLNNNSNIKQYIFFDTVVPVKLDGKYGFFDIKGNKLCDLKYTGVGCYAKPIVETNNKEDEKKFRKTTPNIIEIEDYELLVVEDNEKFGLVNTEGREVVKATATDVYSTVSAGIKSYYMLYNDYTINLETEVFDKIGLKKKSEIIEETNNKEELDNNVTPTEQADNGNAENNTTTGQENNENTGDNVEQTETSAQDTINQNN